MNENSQRSGHPAVVIGIFGAGKFGLAIARRALTVGYRVKIATSGPIEKTALIAAAAAPAAIASTAAELAQGTDLVLLAVPLHRFRELPLPQFAGHVVIDMMNYWPPIDGAVPEFERSTTPTSVLVRDALPSTARLVKTINHLSYHQIEDLARPPGSPDRTAIAISGDDLDAVRLAATIVDRLGFDPVRAGHLLASAALQPGSALFGANLDAATMRRVLDANRTTAA